MQKTENDTKHIKNEKPLSRCLFNELFFALKFGNDGKKTNHNTNHYMQKVFYFQ